MSRVACLSSRLDIRYMCLGLPPRHTPDQTPDANLSPLAPAVLALGLRTHAICPADLRALGV